VLEKLGITSSELAWLRPGIVQVDFSIYGAVGPWANRIGFDHTAGGVSGVLALEGSVEEPKLPEISFPSSLDVAETTPGLLRFQLGESGVAFVGCGRKFV
jgi:crotonobetainyl-CoA:carnitine CoA-transferase CaiB-like acyl-CoA transferase